MIGSKKRFRPTNLCSSRQTQDSHPTPPQNTTTQPATESASVTRDESAVLHTPSQAPCIGSHEIQEDDPIFPTHPCSMDSSTPVSSSPLPGYAPSELDRTSNTSPHASTDEDHSDGDATLVGKNLSEENSVTGEMGDIPDGDDGSMDLRSRQIRSKMKSAKRRNDPQLMKLLSRPELFDPDQPLDRESITMSELIRLSSIKFRDPNAAKDRSSGPVTQALLEVEKQTPQEKEPQRKSLQVRIVNGNLVLDEESALIPAKRQDAAGSDEVVFEYGVEGQAFQCRHKRSYKVRKWSDSETKLLLQGLSQFGTDFSIIKSVLFPNRTRIEIKNKFKREEKAHPVRINKALSRKIPVMKYIYRDDLDDGK